ncbi:MAG: molybdenum cofactor biosynthesis protein MoaE [Candidatus Acidiferrum sp.]|jgi:molybdopterin synthase catalytic subunit
MAMKKAPQPDLLALVLDPIDHVSITQHVRAAEDGAVVTFDGCVRNHSQGRGTLYLDYEAYETMALAKIREIAEQLHEKFPIHLVAIVHRLGRLQIGETSVYIAVSSEHRPAAFEACRYAIDTLKRTVPIWKKEYFEDGAVWADGEMPPAPPETRAANPAS